jgi:hypothetical protein
VKVTVDTICAELAQLESACTWNVREISPSEFAVAFPQSWSEMTILTTKNIKVSIKPSCLDRETVATLSEVWVLVHGIPEEARKQPFLELIS